MNHTIDFISAILSSRHRNVGKNERKKDTKHQLETQGVPITCVRALTGGPRRGHH